MPAHRHGRLAFPSLALFTFCFLPVASLGTPCICRGRRSCGAVLRIGAAYNDREGDLAKQSGAKNEEKAKSRRGQGRTERERAHERADRRTDGWTNEGTNKRTKERRNEGTKERRNEGTNEGTNKRTKERTNNKRSNERTIEVRSRRL